MTRASPVIVSGNTEPDAKAEVFVNGTVQGSVKAEEKGAFSYRINLTEGNNAISAVAYDATGNVSASSVVTNVFMDTKPPRIL